MSSDSSGYSRGLLAINWAIMALSTCFVAIRLYARYWRFSKFYWDDFFVTSAWALSVPMACQVTFASRHNTVLSSKDFYQDTFLSRPITQLFFYNALWAVKISFLIFFRRIGVVALPTVHRYWTIVTTLTIAAYIGTWLLNPYDCWTKKSLKECDRDPGVAKFTPIALSFATAFDVITDCLIVAIPFAVLSHMRLTSRQKLVLYSIFSFELVTMLVAIIRVVISVLGFTQNKMFRITLLLFLSHVEVNTAIIVACAGTLRSLFTQKDDRSVTPPVPWDNRPPNNDIVLSKQAGAKFAAQSLAKKPSDDELVLTSSHHIRQPSRPFETDIPIDLGDLLKKS